MSTSSPPPIAEAVEQKAIHINTADLSNAKALYVSGFRSPTIELLDDTLEEQENPVEFLKAIEKNQVVIVVPNEWSWVPELKPFTNPKHRHHYDPELLAQDLEAAGLIYAMKLLEFSGWSFIGCEAVREKPK